ncbi:hypothetical protein GCM10010495_57070 [Kitasatospora herbaricolor]|uniref:hypothetical protein n=1 Tax=Kitasatospora herbaricolor TaxID=68217 RepID=UPI0019B61064|nr:hypothetical protein [Kitasatospora herbaricolor]MDQ0309896.1 hypothetical protein [Kitasatospora herbaricolor]GGV32824.1 hypothetical protein GCM10010495_57070 [Kitasatospora herbaricolor]
MPPSTPTAGRPATAAPPDARLDARLDATDRTEALFTGEFEIHVTVRCEGRELQRLDRWAVDRGVKLTHIVLARGRTTSQPMLTLGGPGTLREQRRTARATAAELRDAGFEPIRVKIEATPWTSGVPATDAAAARLGPAFYFEHHLKVLLGPGTGREDLAGVSGPHAAHVSWNARRTDRAGRQERFVTQRCHGVGLATAGERLARLVDAVSGAGFEIVSVEREFVVSDSDITVDDGWLDDASVVGREEERS